MELNEFKCEICPKKMEWIPVTDRLPDKAGFEVLAMIENLFGQRRVCILFSGYGDSEWHCNNREIDMAVWSVLAWMPLPEPFIDYE